MRDVKNRDDGASYAIALDFEVCVNSSYTTCDIAAVFVTPHAKQTLEVL